MTKKRTAPGLTARNKRRKNHKKSKKVHNPDTSKPQQNCKKEQLNLKDHKKPYKNKEELINYFKNLFSKKEESEEEQTTKDHQT